MRVTLLLMLFGLTFAQPDQARVDNGKTKADIKRKGGQISVTPSADSNDGIETDLVELAEVDKDGEEIRGSQGKRRKFNKFADLSFNVSDPADKEFAGLQWKAVEMTASLPNGTAVIKLEILNALESGEIEIEGELQAISEGFVKINIILNWMFCKGANDTEDCGTLPGEALLMKLRVKGKGKARGKQMMKKADHETMRRVTKQKERPQKSRGKPVGGGDRTKPTKPANGQKPTGSGGATATRPVNGERPSGPPTGGRTTPGSAARPTGSPSGRRTTPASGEEEDDDEEDSGPPVGIREKLGGKRWSHIIPDDLRGKENKTLPDVFGFGTSDDDDDGSYMAWSRVMTVDGEGRQMDPDFPSVVSDADGSVVTIKFDKFNRTLIYDPTFIVDGAADVTPDNGGSSTTSSASTCVFSFIFLCVLLTLQMLFLA